MTLGQVFQVATDQELRLLAGFANPPKAGKVLQTLPSGQVEVELDEVEGGTIKAWPLNGWTYGNGTTVYVVFASDSADSGIVVGAKGAGARLGRVSVGGDVALADGIAAPSTLAGYARLYVDAADGDLKVRFGDGVVKTIVTDT